ncbi:esterase/lipase family protein [candidate division CSSED10-310 bacterium]|uniref:Esterase/lipase family protein n=1 Tax=candidate division CSSED10-310 bacterium TaxID=2855610 RepID=A0ABV6Z2R2_UNCC1
MKHAIFLVPGFLGFKQIGGLYYFHGVREILKELLPQNNVEAEVFRVKTRPTASIRKRAEALMQTIIDEGGLEAENITLIGHSTGGLDARLIATPHVFFKEIKREKAVMDRLKNVITVSTPHYGTPLAQFFTSAQGRNALNILSSMSVSLPGRIVLTGASRLIALVAVIDDYFGQKDTGLDFLVKHLLEEITLNKDAAFWQFLHDISEDAGALFQLTPEVMDLFNAVVMDNESVHYASIINSAPPPSWVYGFQEFKSIYSPISMGLFTVIYALTRRPPKQYPYPKPDENLARRIDQNLGFKHTDRSNDGVVPLLSQIWGDVIHVTLGDHLDVVGQFEAAGGNPKYATWLTSGSKFNEKRFRELWKAVAFAIKKSEEDEQKVKIYR